MLELLDGSHPPPPAQDEVLVRVLSRPVHPGDLIGVRGGYRPQGSSAIAPAGVGRPGFEGFGIVEALGAGHSKGLALGSRVAFFPAKGAWGEQVLAPVQFVTPVPDGVSDAIASQLHVNPLTAAMLLRAASGSGLEASDLIVFSAAGSAVARLAIKLALGKGLSVVGLVRSNQGAESLQTMFPEAAILSTEAADWPDRLRAIAGKRPIRAVLDPVGGQMAGRLIDLLADGGAFIGYGDLSGEPIPVQPLVFPVRGLRMSGVSVGRWAGLSEAERTEDIKMALELAHRSPELFSVAAEYDLSAITEAVAHAEQPGRSGTVLLTSK
ncbi:zinc-binding dehydrogenase [Martelella radicis]|uniref:NADPH:quinone reductase-like Zn-dependent oxidoreductase n=1 Tax=Martelella radicis TaxID=1397476 RepID=A0A7W6P7F9_9HYPH|nr:NADPH:quinone reductase-like Zn-dependent oxidoreductase [Martelella radicis]